MKRIILFIILIFNIASAVEVKELSWPSGESFLTFLEKYSIPQKLYFELEKEDKELAAEIRADRRYYLYENEDGSLNQVLIPVSEDIQLHIYKDAKGEYKFQTLPINYNEYIETIAVPVTVSISYDLQKATGDVTLGEEIKALFKGQVNFRKLQKGDFVGVKYRHKSWMGRPLGQPEVLSAMVEVAGKKHYKFYDEKDGKFYDKNGKGATKSYFFKIPLTYKRISSHFTKRRYHPVLKRYRAHLGTDFAAPTGRKIYAAGNGRIEFAGRRGGYGKTIVIRHPNGYKTLYAHQHKFKRGIKRGQVVKKGDHIGYVGSTGLSSGPHLHLGVYKNGRAVNPLTVIKKPVYSGLKGKRKATFVANAKKFIKTIDSEMKNEDRKKATRHERITHKSDLEEI